MSEYEKKRLYWSRLGAVATAVILLIVLILGIVVFVAFRDLHQQLQQVSAVVQRLDEITAQLNTIDWEDTADAVNSLSAQLKEAELASIVENLNQVSSDLADIDWQTLVSDVDTLAASSQESLAQAMGAIEELDIKTLNEAIADLKAVVEPLAKLLGRK